jgi:hypothetical protein
MKRHVHAAPQSRNVAVSAVKSFETLGLMDRVENPAEPYQPGKYYAPEAAKPAASPSTKGGASPAPAEPKKPASPGATPLVPSMLQAGAHKGKPPGSPKPKGGKKR